MAAEICRKETKQECPTLGKKWWRGFKRRHPDITTKQPRSLELARAKNANQQAIDGFYELLEKTCRDKDIGPGQIWNVDEKGFTPDPLPKRVVASHTAKSVQLHQKSHDHVTASICISAAGVYLPPQLIFNRKKLASSLVSDGPPGALYSTSDKGSMDQELFAEWFERIFLAGTPRTKCQLLLLDNHASHISVKVLDMARQANITFLALPSKTTHLLQPLDKTVFSSLAAQHQAVSAAARLLRPEHIIKLSDFVPIFTEAFHKSMTPSNILTSFRITGICPLDRNAIPPAASIPSEVFTSSTAPDVHQWTAEELKLYEKRLAEGYDLRDERYEAWKAWREQEKSSTGSTATMLPLAKSLVEAGTLSEGTAALFQMPAITPRRLPSAASQARSLTSDEFFSKLQETEKEKAEKAETREANRRERERRKAEKAANVPPTAAVDTPPATPPPLEVCAICYGECPSTHACPDCAIHHPP